MFDERVKINFKEKNIITKKINNQEFRMYQWLDEPTILYIITDCIDKFNSLLNEENNFITICSSVMAQMDISLCIVSTNVDIDNMSYEEVAKTGLIEIVKKYLLNYDMIKNSVISAMNLSFTKSIIDNIDKLSSLDGLSGELNKIVDMFQSNPEKASEWLKINMANNPTLMKMLSEEIKE